MTLALTQFDTCFKTARCNFQLDGFVCASHCIVLNDPLNIFFYYVECKDCSYSNFNETYFFQNIALIKAIYIVTKHNCVRGGSRIAVTSKMEHFVIIVNEWKPLTIMTKSSILDFATVLDPPLCMQPF